MYVMNGTYVMYAKLAMYAMCARSGRSVMFAMSGRSVMFAMSVMLRCRLVRVNCVLRVVRAMRIMFVTL